MQTQTTAKDFFLYLGILITLYAGVGFLLGLLVSIINTAFPPINSYYSPSISFPVAALIVLTPIFLWLSYFAGKDQERNPEKKNIWVRRWFIFFTLFGTGALVAGDLITLLYYFLDGRDLTAGFLLKVLAFLAVAGTVFAYYLAELRNRVAHRKVWRIGVALGVLVIIVLGFSIMGSPRTQRMIRYDEQKLSDLQNIQSQIVHSWWQQKGTLPQDLAELNDPLGYFSLPMDPQTKGSYGYEKTGDLSFRLCAEFNRASDGKNVSRIYSYGLDSKNENWKHDAGEFCFDRTIDPQLYPVDKRLID